MENRCPNCGNPTRPGARFCTSCGFRLPEQPAESPAPTVGRSPFATTSTISSWWPGQQQSSSSDADRVSESESAPAETASAAQESAPEPVTEEAAPASADFEAASAPAAEPETVTASAAETQATEEVSAEPATQEESATPSSAATSWEETLAAFSATRTPEPVTTTSGNEGQDQDPLGRAESLLDELRALLPELAQAKTSSGVDPEAVAASLAAAREELALKRSALESLGDVAERAQAHPRDLDVMLDLVARAGAIVELKSAYSRALSAMDDALRALRRD